MKTQIVKERLQTLIGFVENMESLVKNPYTAGLKTDEMLKDIKAFIDETILELDKEEDKSEEAEKAE